MGPTVLDHFVRATSLLSGETSFAELASRLVEQSIDLSQSAISALYLFPQQSPAGNLMLAHRRGRGTVPDSLPSRSELVLFLKECGKSVVLLSRTDSPFSDAYLIDDAVSAIAVPLATKREQIGVLILNACVPDHYTRDRLHFLDSLATVAGGLIHNARLYRELQEYLRTIEELQRYQENVFESMTNLLITTDETGRIHYFNRAAADRLGLSDTDHGKEFRRVFASGLTKSVLSRLDTVEQSGKPLLGIEGIYKTKAIDMDFALNITPLRGKRGRHEGLTFLFTDQSSEKKLRAEMKVAHEERRVIKDMFASYLSEDIVEMLVEHPELVKPGGGSRHATVFFADIAGYTSFSEGRDPAAIVKILNEFFEEAEPIVRRNRGYLDKYIGDCIMAVFGVPVDAGAEDTVRAVTCAVELQRLVNDANRTFFRGEAENLRIQIGMHTGPVIAGNLGGSRRMDFTEIGDTVNVAARLEGVAGPGEVIISADTREQIGDLFALEKRSPAKVKGKSKPIEIFNVTGLKSA
ncbi:MAG: PAS domain S-box protein [Spirochaetaceae bacterium]|nr:MAG: PAS domain S-box protein [Spirochaetaceae bacterium]